MEWGIGTKVPVPLFTLPVNLSLLVEVRRMSV